MTFRHCLVTGNKGFALFPFQSIFSLRFQINWLQVDCSFLQFTYKIKSIRVWTLRTLVSDTTTTAWKHYFPAIISNKCSKGHSTDPPSYPNIHRRHGNHNLGLSDFLLSSLLPPVIPLIRLELNYWLVRRSYPQTWLSLYLRLNDQTLLLSLWSYLLHYLLPLPLKMEAYLEETDVELCNKGMTQYVEYFSVQWWYPAEMCYVNCDQSCQNVCSTVDPISSVCDSLVSMLSSALRHKLHIK